MTQSLYRGWTVLGGTFFISMLAVGLTHYSAGLYIVPVSNELTLSRADANTGIIVMSIASALLAPFVGKMLDRWSATLIMVCGGLCFSLGFLMISVTHSPWVMLVAMIPIAFAADATGGIAGYVLTNRWFRRRRGRALGFMTVSASVGGFAMAPLTGFLIGEFGWRTALQILGIGAGSTTILLALIFVRSRPRGGEMEAVGEVVDSVDDAAEKREHEIWTYGRLLTNPLFWLLAGGASLILASDRAIIVSVAPFLSDKGVTVQMAGMMMSALTLSAFSGKIVVGFLLEHVSPYKIYILVAVLHIVMLYMFILYPGYWVLFGTLVVMGLGFGGIMPVVHMLLVSNFGSASYGTVLGAVAVTQQLFSAIVIRGVGEIHDHSGSYNVAFLMLIGAVAISTLLVLRSRNRTKYLQVVTST